MSYRKAQASELKAPPDHPVEWRVRAGDCMVTVKHRRWFDARKDGAMQLGVEPEQVTLETDGL